MPLGEIFGGRDGHHDPRLHVFAEAASHVCAQGVRSALGEVPQQLPAAPEGGAQKARNRRHHVAVGDWLQHLLAEPLGP